MKVNDLANHRSGKLLALAPTCLRDSKGYVVWKCQCDCGNLCHASSIQILNKTKKSCGCLQKESLVRRNKQLAQYPEQYRRERLYRIWKGIYARTHYPSQQSYKDYGGRGITLCPEWEHDYLAFRSWALANGYNDDLTIERKNVDGNYEPSNCSWISRQEQVKNQRSNIVLTYNGESHIASEWADIMGISHSCLYKRIQRNYPLEKIFKELQ